MTVKGKGYEVAEGDARKWHGVVPFDLETCELPGKKTGPVAYTAAFGDSMRELAREDQKVVAITAAMPDGTGLTEFAKEFPDQYFDVGIAEQHAVTFAAGLAAGGLRPYCTIYSTFLQRGFDQVLHDVCIQNLPVRFALDRSGLVGDDGPTHHGAFDISYLTFIPKMSLIAPRDATELGEMLRYMRTFDSGPIAIRYPRGTTDDMLPESRTPIQFGQAEVLGTPGFSREEIPDPVVTFVAIGSMVGEAWRAAQVLADDGVHAVVINARFAKPIDIDTIATWAQRSRFVITIEENVKIGGFGQQVRDGLADQGLGSIPIEIMSLPDSWVEHGTQPIIRGECGLDAAGIVERTRAFIADPTRGLV